MFVKEPISFLQTGKLVGNKAGKDGPQQRAGQMFFYQTANVQIDIVHRLVHGRQAIHHGLFHGGEQLIEADERRQSANGPVGVVAGQPVVTSSPQV